MIRVIASIAVSFPIFFFALLMFTYVVTQGTPKNIIPDMIMVDMAVVGGYIILYKAFHTKSTTMTIEMNPL